MTFTPFMIQHHFQRDAEGNVLYFPFAGIWRHPSGYVMEPRHSFRRMMAYMACPLFFVGLIAPSGRVEGWLYVALTVTSCIVYAAFRDALACGLVKSDCPYDKEQARLDSLHMAPRIFIWGDIAFLAVLGGAGVYVSFENGVLAGLPIIAFSLCALVWRIRQTLKLLQELSTTHA